MSPNHPSEGVRVCFGSPKGIGALVRSARAALVLPQDKGDSLPAITAITAILAITAIPAILIVLAVLKYLPKCAIIYWLIIFGGNVCILMLTC